MKQMLLKCVDSCLDKGVDTCFYLITEEWIYISGINSRGDQRFTGDGSSHRPGDPSGLKWTSPINSTAKQSHSRPGTCRRSVPRVRGQRCRSREGPQNRWVTRIAFKQIRLISSSSHGNSLQNKRIHEVCSRIHLISVYFRTLHNKTFC